MGCGVGCGPSRARGWEAAPAPAPPPGARSRPPIRAGWSSVRSATPPITPTVGRSPEPARFRTPTDLHPDPRGRLMSDRASHPRGDVTVTIVLPTGGARSAEVPDDVAVRELLGELPSLLQRPTTGPARPPTGH